MALYLVIQISAFLTRIVPRPLRYFIGTAVGDAVFILWPAKRRILLQNMATVLGLPPHHKRVRQLALKSMRNYCKYLIEFLELAATSSPRGAIAGMNIEGLDRVQDAINLGKGVIIATAHFGTIEVGAIRLVRMTRFHAVSDTFKPPYLDRLIRQKRLALGINPIPVSNIRAMLRALHQGDALGLLFDRPVDGTKGVPVRFFGRETAVPAGPAVLALKTGAALLPAYQFRQPDRSFEGIILPPITCTPSGDRDSDIQGIMQKLMDTYQVVIRQRPDQWYMFRPMWPVEAGSAQLLSEAATDRSFSQ